MKKNKGIHPEIIKAKIRMRGETLSSLARSKEVSESAVSKALVTPSTIGERIISEFLNIPLHHLWPDRWTDTGQRIRPRYRYKYNSSS